MTEKVSKMIPRLIRDWTTIISFFQLQHLSWNNHKNCHCLFCHKFTKMSFHNNSYIDIKCSNCGNFFYACANPDCNFCIQQSKPSIIYLKKHLSSKEIKYSHSYKSNKSSKPIHLNNVSRKLECTSFHRKWDLPICISWEGLSKIQCFHCDQHLHVCINFLFWVLDTKRREKKTREHGCNQMGGGGGLYLPGQFSNFSDPRPTFQNGTETDLFSHLSDIEFNQEMDGDKWYTHIWVM